jgi:hypothetical protein
VGSSPTRPTGLSCGNKEIGSSRQIGPSARELAECGYRYGVSGPGERTASTAVTLRLTVDLGDEDPASVLGLIEHMF